jgi:hypothetical protein
MSGPRFARPDLCSIRAVAEQAEPAGAVHGEFSADGRLLGDDDLSAPSASGIDRAICLSTVAAVLAMASIAAYVSYGHAYAVIRAHGETGITAQLEAATIDGLMYASSMFSRGRLTVVQCGARALWKSLCNRSPGVWCSLSSLIKSLASARPASCATPVVAVAGS